MASRVKEKGYWIIKWYEHGVQFKKFEHRIIWEQANGPIPEGHFIHHINEVRDDNRLENLQCVTQAEHNTIHFKKHDSNAAKCSAYYYRNHTKVLENQRKRWASRSPEVVAAQVAKDRQRYLRKKEQRANG